MNAVRRLVAANYFSLKPRLNSKFYLSAIYLRMAADIRNSTILRLYILKYLDKISKYIFNKNDNILYRF